MKRVKIIKTSTFFNIRQELTFEITFGDSSTYVGYPVILDGDDMTSHWHDKLICLCVSLGGCNLNQLEGKELDIEFDPELLFYENIDNFMNSLTIPSTEL